MGLKKIKNGLDNGVHYSKTNGDMVLGEPSLPFFLRFYIYAPLTFLFIVTTGLLFSLPPGPLCDEGMILFMEGGCDWGASNIFFFSKLGLLTSASVALIACSKRKVNYLHFWPHFIGLAILSVIFIGGGGCDTYYSHPNGSIGQMVLEIIALSLFGITLNVIDFGRPIIRVIFLHIMNVGIFYLGLTFFQHWEWTHTFFIIAVFLLTSLLTLAYFLRKNT